MVLLVFIYVLLIGKEDIQMVEFLIFIAIITFGLMLYILLGILCTIGFLKFVLNQSIEGGIHEWLTQNMIIKYLFIITCVVMFWPLTLLSSPIILGIKTLVTTLKE